MFSTLWKKFRTPLLIIGGIVSILLWFVVLNPLLLFISTTTSTILWAAGWAGVAISAFLVYASVTSIIKKLIANRKGTNVER